MDLVLETDILINIYNRAKTTYYLNDVDSGGTRFNDARFRCKT